MSRGYRLEEELGVFELHKKEWLRSNPGDFVVVAGANVIGFYSDFESALKAGLTVVGLGTDFLVKQVLAEEPVYIIFGGGVSISPMGSSRSKLNAPY